MEPKKVRVTGPDARALNRMRALKKLINEYSTEFAKLREQLNNSEVYNFNAPAIYETKEAGAVLEVSKRKGKCSSVSVVDAIKLLSAKGRMDLFPKIVGSIDTAKFVSNLRGIAPKKMLNDLTSTKQESIWNFIGIK